MPTVSDVVHRGTSNVLANWPAVAIQGAVAYLASALLIAGEPVEVGHWLPTGDLGWVLVVILAAVVVFALLVVYSFIMAGNAFIYVDGERAARAARALPSEVSSYRVFDVWRWLEAARSSMWRVAGIYCAATAIVVLAMGLIFTIAAILHQTACSLACGGTVLAALAVLAVGFGLAICLPKAIVICVGRSLSSRESLRLAWGEALDDIGAHVWPVIVACFIAFIAGSGIVGLRSLLEGTSPRWVATWIMPFVEQGVAAVGACWFLAIMTALTDVTLDEDSGWTPVPPPAEP